MWHAVMRMVLLWWPLVLYHAMSMMVVVVVHGMVEIGMRPPSHPQCSCVCAQTDAWVMLCYDAPHPGEMCGVGVLQRHAGAAHLQGPPRLSWGVGRWGGGVGWRQTQIGVGRGPVQWQTGVGSEWGMRWIDAGATHLCGGVAGMLQQHVLVLCVHGVLLLENSCVCTLC